MPKKKKNNNIHQIYYDEKNLSFSTYSSYRITFILAISVINIYQIEIRE